MNKYMITLKKKNEWGGLSTIFIIKISETIEDAYNEITEECKKDENYIVPDINLLEWYVMRV